MENKYLISNLQLAYSPLSAYDFTVLKKDTSIHKALNDSSLYAIVQRGELRFDNICSESYKDNVKLSFEIRQKGNPHVLQCSFLVYQKNLLEDLSKEVVLCVGSSEAKNDLSKMPFFNIQGIKLLEYDKFKIWFSPEKFLQNYWKGYFNAEIKGDLKEFTKYTVLYVGKATNQDIWKRLSGHETLQDILALEEPIYTGSIPKDEIAILFFKIEDNISINSFDNDSPIEDMVEAILGINIPSKQTIFLDVEKALIKAMSPKYNKEIYKNYPISKDGLYKHNLNAYFYKIKDSITLLYSDSEISGSYSHYCGDTIIVEENKSIKIHKSTSSVKKRI